MSPAKLLIVRKFIENFLGESCKDDLTCEKCESSYLLYRNKNGNGRDECIPIIAAEICEVGWGQANIQHEECYECEDKIPNCKKYFKIRQKMSV